jgi:hypothetical protein
LAIGSEFFEGGCEFLAVSETPCQFGEIHLQAMVDARFLPRPVDEFFQSKY